MGASDVEASELVPKVLLALARVVIGAMGEAAGGLRLFGGDRLNAAAVVFWVLESGLDGIAVGDAGVRFIGLVGVPDSAVTFGVMAGGVLGLRLGVPRFGDRLGPGRFTFEFENDIAFKELATLPERDLPPILENSLDAVECFSLFGATGSDTRRFCGAD